MHDSVIFYEDITSKGQKLSWDEMAKLIQDRSALSKHASLVDELLKKRPELVVPKDENFDLMDLMSVEIPKKD